uniref:NADH-ubiquinone oxidoreductase chain 3 n=1 Tax=Encyrtus sasakii TaxID=1914890 RepID=A0A7S5FJM5_9HYME|nr:NADH dehydrogenase subunit 3 [Encyrtus sasakii]QGA47453.1 NADH dehydrogenase subunit 3 [Encyrtus sasakii]QGA47466.1 NADH dehydrogenase subunit 3 [Encyrtus sasakii]QGA74437.1 NADH dehydrogenase subunit 3 [Encyrtus sasakii]QGA74450.1 NADH dehydrogenase subunit 3 [Encyrtus sasakii]
MLFLFSLILICMTLVFFMFLLNMFFSKKFIKNREKMTPFECGFDSMSVSRLPFSLQFYLVSVIFLIFDVEIALIMPLIYLNYLTYSFMIFSIFFILLILLGGLYLEWLEGALMWFK